MSKQHVETNIQNEIRLALSEHGIVLRMQSGMFYTEYGDRIKIGVDGLSDLLFIGDGYVAFLEVKKPKGVRSTKQKNFTELMQKMGHKAGFVESVDDALKVIGVK